MSDDTNNKPTLTRKPLTLSRSLESGEVKQTFSHGRTNKVVVEVKRKKLVGKPGYALEAEVAAPPPPPAAPVAAAPAPRPTGNDMLSRQERQAKLLREAEEARLAMLEESSRREAEQRAQRADEERQRARLQGSPTWVFDGGRAVLYGRVNQAVLRHTVLDLLAGLAPGGSS